MTKIHSVTSKIEKSKVKPKKLIHPRGILRYGTRTNVFDKELCKRIRKRLKLTAKQLPDRDISKVIDIANLEIAKWVVENAEGCKLHKDMGILCVSKHLPREFSPDKEEKVENIKEIKISELKRKQILKSYDIDVGDKLDLIKLGEIGEKIPLFDLSTFFYTYRLIWFNHRNCKTRKARVYRLKPTRYITRDLYKAAVEGKDYYEWNFHDFYRHRLNPRL